MGEKTLHDGVHEKNVKLLQEPGSNQFSLSKGGFGKIKELIQLCLLLPSFLRKGRIIINFSNSKAEGLEGDQRRMYL